jgi:TRAP-type C4-dicarboxylate transport system permease small subunit
MKKWFGLFRFGDEFISCLSLVVVLIVVFINVLTRFFLRQSIIVADEIAAIGFVYSIFFGVSVCYKRKMHIAIDIVVNLLPAYMKKISSIVIAIFMLLTNLLLAFYSFQLAISASKKLTAAIGLSYFWVDLSMFIAFALCSFYALLDLVRQIRNFGKGNSVSGSSHDAVATSSCN